MSTTTVSPASSNVLAGLAATPSTTQIGAQANDAQMNEFLRLLTTQLQNQDPLNPTDPTQFVAQLAQFSTVEQLVQGNASLAAIAQSISGLALGQYAGMIDKTVTAGVSALNLTGSDDPPALDFNVTAAGLANVAMNVLNANGQVVGSVPVSGTSGQVQFNGLDGSGNKLPPDSYQVQLVGTTATGAVQSAGTLSSKGSVSAVTQGTGGAWQLKLDNGLSVDAAGVTSVD